MKEQRLNDIMVKLLSGDITIEQACRLTGLSERQMYRKKKAYKLYGINSIPHKLKLYPSKKGYGQEFKNKIIKLYNEEYFGWNFHHFNDSIKVIITLMFLIFLYTIYLLKMESNLLINIKKELGLTLLDLDMNVLVN